MTRFNDMFDEPLVVFDGGLGTTLQMEFNLDIEHTALWSAKPIVDDPEAIINAHIAFLEAGAKLILTATYQCSFNTFERAGYSKDEGKAIMLKAVALANEARTRFLKKHRGAATAAGAREPHIRIGLALGSYGACIPSMHEYDGFYPPPFGPRAFSRTGENTNAFAPGEDAAEEAAVEALAAYHLERLRVFADDAEAWAGLDCLAFETVPLAREVRAIRRAVGRLQSEVGGAPPKPWWVSLVFPEGNFPDTEAVPLRAAVAAALDDAREGYPAPAGLGVNCTPIETVDSIVAELSDAVAAHPAQGEKPWLVVYPNRDMIFDSATRSWSLGESKPGGEYGNAWAEEQAGIITKAKSEREGVWGGILAGGCCMARPTEIQVLSSILNKPRL